MKQIKISRLKTFELWREVYQRDKSQTYITEALFRRICSENEVSTVCDDKQKDQCLQILKRHVFYFKRAYTKCEYKPDRALKKYRSIGIGEIILPLTEEASKAPAGRPTKTFGELQSKRQKTRRTNPLMTTSASELKYATCRRLMKENRRDEARLLTVSSASPSRPRKMLRAYEKQQAPCASLSAEEALALMNRINLSVRKYKIMRKFTPNVYPPYDKVAEVKASCYPKEEGEIQVTESSASVDFRALVKHTITRICEESIEVFEALDYDKIKRIAFEAKVGSDGTNGVSAFKMKSSVPLHGRNIYVSCLVPLCLRAYFEGGRTFLIWNNPSPGSTKFCRPIQFEFCLETKEKIVAERELLEKCFKNIPPLELCLHGQYGNEVHVVITCKPEDFSYTMIDGKVANAITGTPSNMTCRACKAKPSEMNNIDMLLNREINEEVFKYGFSPMHARIRALEWVLHLAYKNIDGIKVWRARTDHLPLIEEQKKKIQSRFKNEVGLNIDMPLEGGSGNTNDGNTARKVFAEPCLAADITGIDLTFIKRLGVLLDVVNTNYLINPAKFRDYALETARHYVQLYPWYHMPASMHILLIHGHQIMSCFRVPIGALSEEAMEARNKELKHYRQHHTRKTSRIDCNRDLLHKLLVSSDPKISGIADRKEKKRGKKRGSIRQDVLQLLKTPEDPRRNETGGDCGGKYVEEERDNGKETETEDELHGASRENLTGISRREGKRDEEISDDEVDEKNSHDETDEDSHDEEISDEEADEQIIHDETDEDSHDEEISDNETSTVIKYDKTHDDENQ